jgi:glucoamylase
LPADNSEDNAVYPPWSDEILVSLLALARDQKDRFPINSSPLSSSDDDDEAEAEDEEPFEGTGLGRYPEDKYNGYTTTQHGNPWFLCTSSAAEIMYRSASHFSTSSNLTISTTALPFYTALLASSSLDVNEGTYGSNDALFHSIIERLGAVGDQFLNIVRRHVDAEGSMSEQFDKETGYMTGASDLTWSYGAFLQAVRARKMMLSA